MPITIPQNHGISSKKVDTVGNFSKPGWGHFYLEAVDEQADHVKLLFSCLGHTESECVDSKISMWLYFVAGAGKNPAPLYEKIMHTAKVFGLLTAEQIDAGGALAVDFTPAIGRQCVLHIIEREYEKDGQKRKGTNVADKGVYRVDDPVVAEKRVPLDMNHLRLGGYKPPVNQQANGAGPAHGTQSSQAQVALGQAGDSDLAGI